MPRTGLKYLNANFICYATQLPEEGWGGHIILNSEFDFFFFLMIYTYKLLQAFPQKHL